jgi:anti-anti-sigma factor
LYGSCHGCFPQEFVMDPYRILLFGEIDLARRADLASHLEGFRASRHEDVEVDLASVRFMALTRIHFLEELSRIAQGRGGVLTVTAASHPVQRLLELTGFEDLLGASLDDAG